MDAVPEHPKPQAPKDAVEKRIKELGEKSSQLLLFLSFALVVAAVLRSSQSPLGTCQQLAVTQAMRWWVRALFPIVVGILPVKEINWGNSLWYQIVRWSKVVLLWLAIGFIFFGAMQFYYAV